MYLETRRRPQPAAAHAARSDEEKGKEPGKFLPAACIDIDIESRLSAAAERQWRLLLLLLLLLRPPDGGTYIRYLGTNYASAAVVVVVVVAL